MFSISSEVLYDRIREACLDENLLNKIGLSDKQVLKYTDSARFKSEINEIALQGDFSGKKLITLLRPILKKLAGAKIPDDWLMYIYQYTLSLSFPKAVTIRLFKSLNKACTFYLAIFRVICDIEKDIKDGRWISNYTLEFLSAAEIKDLNVATEYKTFIKAFRNEYIYEMMKLNQEVMGYTSLEHITGVHYLAMFIARQLKTIGLDIDLGRVSGAAAGHDIGKFGCKASEGPRVPYLHYYYTDIWFQKHNIIYIRNIAINHSTWDLELENLSLENLILIYCDFRVKKKGNSMYIYSLKEAFDVVLDMLDNLDKEKEMRYRRVYMKLKDFEDFMISLGVDLNVLPLKKPGKIREQRKYYSLMHGQEVIENIRHLSIKHNISLMYKLRDEFSLNSIIEMARCEEDSGNLRGYLDVFEEYSMYFTQKQKLITLRFLYEQLIHPEEDIRQKCAEIMGEIIATFDEIYRKEVPKDIKLKKPAYPSYILLDDYINMFLYPSNQIISTHRRWIGECITRFVQGVFKKSDGTKDKLYIKTLLGQITGDEDNFDHRLKVINMIEPIPINVCNKEEQKNIYSYLNNFYRDARTPEDRLLALEASLELIVKLDKVPKSLKETYKDIYGNMDKGHAIENLLRYKLGIQIGIEKRKSDKLNQYVVDDKKSISKMFLSNLKTATHWITKKYQIQMILEDTLKFDSGLGVHTAIHFCNLVKVSANKEVRKMSGDALIQLVPKLDINQRNDIVIELLRSLEIEGYQFSKFIPKYLGRLMMFLQPTELDELLDDLREKIKQSSPKIIGLILNTVGVCIKYYSTYDVVKEDDKSYEDRYIKMMGILLNGLVNNSIEVRQIASSTIGKDLFGSKSLSLQDKEKLLGMLGKKLLTLLGEKKSIFELYFLINTTSLNYIYRFISEYRTIHETIHVKDWRKIAFFPGSFDPFSLSHKEIAREIRNKGFEVFLAVDEFSWSKRTQPNRIRRKIIEMSIADELGIFLLPDNKQINIANPKDIRTIKDVFKDFELYLVAGSDVITNASAYKNFGEDAITSLSHIVFDRASELVTKENEKKLNKILSNIKGDVVRFSLPAKFEHISSTQIRSYIDQNRDISSLVDPLVQKYIYTNSLYRREPQYKSLVETISVSIEIADNLSEELINQLTVFLKNYNNDAYNILKNISSKLWPRVMILRDMVENGKIIGFSIFHWIRSNMLFSEFNNIVISEHIRNNYLGRIVLIDTIFIDDEYKNKNFEQVIITETLALCLEKDYTYGVYRNVIDGYEDSDVVESLKHQGFTIINQEDDNLQKVYSVNMSAPTTLYLGMESFIKEPFVSNPNIIRVITKCRKRLQMAIADLYPNNLVLAIDKKMVYEKVIKKVCAENNVPIHSLTPRNLGDAMCVPFGQILKGHIIPNTVTKSMNTEKYFWPDGKKYLIDMYPHHMSLENQVKMIKSFDRPVILVDDLLNKGYRIKAIDPILKKLDVQVDKTIVGILSGRGKELMDIQGREVDSAYFIPKLRVWFNESSMYPFIGGDTLWRGVFPKMNLIPSINLILPYISPKFIKNASKVSIYNLSKVSIENAIELMQVIETEYQKLNERGLTLAHLGEIFISPRFIDKGDKMKYDLNISPTTYLKNDLVLLKRLKHSLCDEGDK